MAEDRPDIQESVQEEEAPVTDAPKTLRRRGGGPVSRREKIVSDIPYPKEIHGEDFEFYGPAGYAAEIPDGTEIAPTSADQEFYLDESKLEFLTFDTPGRNLPKKRLYTVKAVHRDGRLVQLPFEDQIQNNAGGDPEDAIGLRRYQRKGIHLFIDLNTLVPLYCAAWGCWAQAAQTGAYVAFCSLRHAKHTLPNQFKDANEITKGLMEAGVTTSRTWSA